MYRFGQRGEASMRLSQFHYLPLTPPFFSLLVVAGREVIYFGMRYAVPVVAQWPGTVIAVNVGGAVMPPLMSLYLLFKYRIWGTGLLATAGVTLVCYWL